MKKTIILTSTLLFTSFLSMQTAQASDFTNSLGMQFVNISPGNFFMGSCFYSEADQIRDQKLKQQGMEPQGPTCPAGGVLDNEASEEETPQHKVQISKGFQMGVYEVTLGQYNQYVETMTDEERDTLLHDDFEKYNSHGDEAAVTMVSWDGAQLFINWLNQQEKSGNYRLPTEAEWEYCARAGSSTIYPWGDERDINAARQYSWFNINEADMEKWFTKDDKHDREVYARLVGKKEVNPWGLYDMQGNVWEWVQDWYSVDYYHTSPVSDPQGPEISKTKVFRGGSWYGTVESLRCSYRGLNESDNHSNSTGFRLVRQP